MKDYARATREPFLNLHFCGTDTATQWQGYLDGAIESGERVANEVLYSLFHSDLTSTIKIDYEKTYYHHRDQIREIVARQETKTKRYEKLQTFVKSLLKYSTLIAGAAAGSMFLMTLKFELGLSKMRLALK